MTTISDVLGDKSHEVLTIDTQRSVQDAVERMAERLVGSLVVLTRGRPCGLLTERQVMLEVILHGCDPRRTTVGEIARRDITWVDPECSLERCMSLMTERRTRQVLVGHPPRLVLGLVSIGDVVKRLAAERSREVDQLHEYIQGAVGPWSWVRPDRAV